MARIRTPIAVNELLRQLPSSEWLPLMDKYKVTDTNGDYLHWDKFKWRVEKGDNEQAAWLATKLARKSVAKIIPELYGKDKTERFHYSVPDSLYAKLHYIDKITGGGHTLGDAGFVSGQEKDRYLVKSLMMEEAITSSQLEGAATTRKVAKEMLISNRPPQDKSEQMILNNYLLMKKVFEKKDEVLTVDLLLELHKIATYNAIDNNAVPGELRTTNDIRLHNTENTAGRTLPVCE
jgi:Fic family protein